ncbi:MAG: helix-turn-helix domain-containing protein [Alphaproteobacteria bacterium]
MTIGDRIREKRKLKDWTLEYLAEKISSSKSYVWEIENNKKSISAEKLMNIAKALETTTDYLLGGSDFIMQENANSEEGARDNAFYRQYSQMPSSTKTKLQKMLDLLDEED